MPKVCWRHNTRSDAVPDYKAVDFEVVWNANVNLLENYTLEDFDTDLKTDEILCATDRTRAIYMHESVKFWKSGLTPKMDRMVGFSTLNVLLFNGLTTDGKDAVLNEYLKMDECLTETEGKNKIMHAHTISPCASPTASTLVSTT
jgi:predicted P-loop ATPase/GTPase